MAFEQRNGSGVLFRNTKKGDNQKSPDYTGNALSPSGEYFELSAWIKEGTQGKFMSIALQPKFVKAGGQSPQQIYDDDRDVPF
jgi:hypothetical protein